MLSCNELKGCRFSPHGQIIYAKDISTENKLYLLFDSNFQIWVRKVGDHIFLPTDEDIENDVFHSEIAFGYLDDYLCVCAQAESLGDKYELYDLKETITCFLDQYPMFARAKMILHWHLRSLFCGKCGGKTHMSTKEICKVCDDCGEIYFPVIAPAVIVLIRKKDKILLAHNVKFKNGTYSIIAGFTEAGESFEENIAREVEEEVGIKIKNIRYFGSQAWPFPNSHMVGFMADYESGEIQPDNHELDDAGWFSVDKLPPLPSNISISRKLLDAAISEINDYDD